MNHMNKSQLHQSAQASGKAAKARFLYLLADTAAFRVRQGDLEGAQNVLALGFRLASPVAPQRYSSCKT